MRMLWSMIAFLVFLYDFENAVGDVVPPQNLAVVAGSGMVMTCTVDSRYIFRSWTLQRPSDELEQEQTIFEYSDTRPPSGQFGVRRDGSGSCDLYKNSTAAEDAGTYRCVVQEQRTKQLVVYSAQLVVFETPPSCQTDLTEGENVSLAKGEQFVTQCRVRYHGNLNLSTEWKQSMRNGDEEKTVFVHSRVMTPRDNTPFTWNVVADFSSPVTFSWRIFFDAIPNLNTDNTTAKNAPSYQYMWKSPLILPPLPSTTARTTGEDVVTRRSTTGGGDLTTITLTTARVDQLLLQVVSENWVVVMLGSIIICFVIVITIVCFCIRSRQRSNAQAQRLYNAMLSIGSNGTVGTSVHNETYDAIDDVIVYSEITSPPTRDAQTRRPSVTSPGYATMNRRLPATPPVTQCNLRTSFGQKKPGTTSGNQDKGGRKGRTIERIRGNPPPMNESLESVKSSSLPNLYNDVVTRSVRSKPEVPHDGGPYGNVNSGGGSACYLTADYLAGDGDDAAAAAIEIASTYLEVNELSKRRQEPIGKTHLDLDDSYLIPNYT